MNDRASNIIVALEELDRRRAAATDFSLCMVIAQVREFAVCSWDGVRLPGLGGAGVSVVAMLRADGRIAETECSALLALFESSNSGSGEILQSLIAALAMARPLVRARKPRPMSRLEVAASTH